ncbi:MAG: polyhydroxyalkanoate synthesis regulator DNA-binding domain-containing protein [Desulfobacterales bacterium]|jgi:polyhydroxyalkanoate synthesis repressor PhaR
MPDRIILKKYANRRLYDNTRSAYVTLEQVAEMIKAGHSVTAVDAKTGEDVTAFVLTQIVLEEAKKKNALLPSALLHMIIRYGDNILGEFFDKYLEQTVKNYLAYKSRVDEQFKHWLDFGTDLSTLAQKSLTGLTPFSTILKKRRDTEDGEKE